MMRELAGLAMNDVAALPLYGVRPERVAAVLDGLPPGQAALARLQDFAGQAGAVVLLTGGDGALQGAVLGLGSAPAVHGFGAAAGALPSGTVWRIVDGDFSGEDAALGFLLGAYRFEHLKTRAPKPRAQLAAAQVPARAMVIASAVCAVRDLINTPANLLGPAELAQAAMDMGVRFGAHTTHVYGAAVAERYPALAAVGAGSERGAEAVLLTWHGSRADADAPLLSLCGKGVCFDTGGYDLKPGAAMLRMKKDMGGAAILLGLAQAVMALDLPLRLQLRIGCVENSISGHAMRPSDVLQTVAGLSVEVGNTDAEGRLVLCDLLAEAASETPDFLIDAATLTGAARVALGPDLPALFCNDERLAQSILAAGQSVNDPLWRLPLFEGYTAWLDSPVADLNTVSAKPMAGAIVAALFLKRFIPSGIAWAHVDVYAWNDSSRPGRPEGGEAQSLRALLAAVEMLGSPANRLQSRDD
ncbi:M17 family metallopeptidase [Acidocella sp.]|uniref:leucyl aminopeptidase family protein n=1 Tax=Acidocella sp. TaxID=50710 RepID=UPI00261B4234|nr:leucyl aminopeptidase family protein [Acidocella sp.]MDD2794754.1 leucyl aminopeptidase family protein [Acidocella sp.]